MRLSIEGDFGVPACIGQMDDFQRRSPSYTWQGSSHTEYQRRISLAQVGINEWIEDARNEKYLKVNKQMWEAIAQYIVKD